MNPRQPESTRGNPGLCRRVPKTRQPESTRGCVGLPRGEDAPGLLQGRASSLSLGVARKKRWCGLGRLDSAPRPPPTGRLVRVGSPIARLPRCSHSSQNQCANDLPTPFTEKQVGPAPTWPAAHSRVDQCRPGFLLHEVESPRGERHGLSTSRGRKSLRKSDTGTRGPRVDTPEGAP